MSDKRPFLDTNVLLYALSEDARKADRVEELLKAGGVVSVQVLNELASVARRKLGMKWAEIKDALGVVRELCTVTPLTLDIHDHALTLAERYGFSIYDASIVSAALAAGAETLYTEDLQDGQRLEGRLVIVDPFRGGR
ncbi:MAG: PIN domain-containing protein [Nitrospirota bacterium]|nr:PIN domain-containing protein [Nitrospirota bacterium]